MRTVYRDIQDLIASGVPINGEAGVGYMLDHTYRLAPLNFDMDEIETLVLGLSMVGVWTDDKMARAARSTLDKIKSTLPTTSLDALIDTALYSFQSAQKIPWTVSFSDIRLAIRTKHKIRFDYLTLDDKTSQRTVRPLAMAFFSPVWLVFCWCELRQDFRNFRLDRMSDLLALEETFRDEPGKRLNDFCPKGDFVDDLRK